MLVRQEDEQPLLHKLYPEEKDNFYCFKVANQPPIGVHVLNEYESQIDFKPKEVLTVIGRELERITEWEGVKVETTCRVAPRDGLVLCKVVGQYTLIYFCCVYSFMLVIFSCMYILSRDY